MAYKDILVHVGGVAYAERLRVAVQLAEAYDAHLVGLHITQPIDIPPYVEAQLSGEVLEAQQRMARQDQESCQAAFGIATKGLSTSVEWRTDQGDAVERLQLHGRHADLVVLGQTNPDVVDEFNLDVVGRVVLSLGRPVLAVPYIGAPNTLGQRVMVAWDGSRTAARAISDAMAMLKNAAEVRVLSLNPDEDRAAMAGVDIATHLARHGIKVEVQHLQASDIEVGAMLLSRAADFGVDLIVMGAYGHARWRELVLGGVTEHMLDHMTVPVLMSH